ncbi:MAG: hypothetical protein ACTSRK_17980 [Promethearchaeota archaeon]
MGANWRFFPRIFSPEANFIEQAEPAIKEPYIYARLEERRIDRVIAHRVRMYTDGSLRGAIKVCC